MNQLKTIRVAVAGIGFIGPVHVESLSRVPGIKVVACHDMNEAGKVKASALGIDSYYTDFDQMLREADLDCVHLCTPNNLHYPMAKKALEAGIHVVCEKPLALTLQEGAELIALAEKKNLVNAVSFNLRYYPLVRQMKRMRENGETGTIHTVMGSYLQDWLFYETDYNWRLEADKSGDSKAVADIGSHLIDLIEYTTGLRVSEVMADFSTVHPIRKKPLKAVETYSGKLLSAEDYADVPIKTEDYASVLLRFENGSKGVVTVSQTSAGRKNRLSVEFNGKNLSTAWCSETPNELWVGQRNEANKVLLRDPSLVDSDVRKIISYPGGHNEGFGDTSKQLFKEIYEAVREGKQPAAPSYPTFKDGLRELLICEKIVESNKLQQWVKVN